MTSGPVTIDLGFDRDEPEIDQPWPGWRPLRGLGVRRWLAAVLAVLVTLPLTAAAGPVPPRIRLVWSLPPPELTAAPYFPAHVLGEHHLYLVEGPAAERILTAYRLADGRARWRTRLPEAWDEGSENPQLVGDVLVVSGNQYPEGGAAPVYLTTAYDPDTGEQLWSREGWISGADDQVVLERQLRWERDPGPWPARVVSAIDPATGRLDWSLELESGTQPVFGRSADGRTYVITLDAQGMLRRLDPSTGAVLATAETSATVESYPEQIGDLLVMTGVVDGVTAYDPETLTPLWTSPVQGWVAACGPVLCGMPGSAIHGLDPATGTVRWTWECGDTGRHCTASQPGFGTHVWVDEQAVRWEAGDREPTVTARISVLDAVTGQLFAAVTGWNALVPMGDSAWLATAPDPRRYGGTTDPGPLPVARIGADLGVEYLGQVAADWWDFSGDYLLAYSARGIEVWRLG